MGALAFPLTVAWIVGIINALNLIDGLDGLAGGVALSACIVNIVVGLVSGNLLVTLLSVALAGALLGFLFLTSTLPPSLWAILGPCFWVMY